MRRSRNNALRSSTARNRSSRTPFYGNNFGAYAVQVRKNARRRDGCPKSARAITYCYTDVDGYREKSVFPGISRGPTRPSLRRTSVRIGLARRPSAACPFARRRIRYCRSARPSARDERTQRERLFRLTINAVLTAVGTRVYVDMNLRHVAL